MQRLKTILGKYSRWQPLSDYVSRIEAYKEVDFTLCIENSKALLESIAKEICKQKGQPLEGTESVGRVLGLSFGSLGYSSTNTVKQIGSAIANVGQQMGNFRNDVGATSHGKTMDELANRQSSIHALTGNFLLESTDIVCCFLIEAFETDNPLRPAEIEIKLDDNPEFNDFWDEQFGEFAMGEYSFFASEILFYNDPNAYKTELTLFKAADETNNGE